MNTVSTHRRTINVKEQARRRIALRRCIAFTCMRFRGGDPTETVNYTIRELRRMNRALADAAIHHDASVTYRIKRGMRALIAAEGGASC